MKGGINLYGYVGGNPISFFDTEGLQTTVINPFAPPLIIPPGSVFEPGSDANDAFVDSFMDGLSLLDPRPLINDIVDFIESCDDKEQICEENLARDLATCRALGKRNGKKAYRICEEQAYLRYARCLRGSDIQPPLPPWGTK